VRSKIAIMIISFSLPSFAELASHLVEQETLVATDGNLLVVVSPRSKKKEQRHNQGVKNSTKRK